MSTGSADLDSLIDGIQEGLFYLFYGNNHVVLEAIVYTFLVNCVLPIKQRYGFESMGVCLNNVDYYDQRKTAALSPEKIGVAAKCAGIDPKIFFKNTYVHPAYNQQHQLTVAEQVADLIESNMSSHHSSAYRCFISFVICCTYYPIFHIRRRTPNIIDTDVLNLILAISALRKMQQD
jgi:hypothetical protein